MSAEFSEDVVPLADLKVNPGRVVKHAAGTHRPRDVTVTRASFAESALADLTGIQERYAEEKAPEVGDHLAAEIFEPAEVLADHPNILRIAPESCQASLRELIHPPSRIVCCLDWQRWRGTSDG